MLAYGWDHDRLASHDCHRVVAFVVEHETHGPSMNHETAPHVGSKPMRPQKTSRNGLVVEHVSGAHKFGSGGKFERGRRHD